MHNRLASGLYLAILIFSPLFYLGCDPDDDTDDPNDLEGIQVRVGNETGLDLTDVQLRFNISPFTGDEPYTDYGTVLDDTDTDYQAFAAAGDCSIDLKAIWATGGDTTRYVSACNCVCALEEGLHRLVLTTVGPADAPFINATIERE